MKKRLSIFLLLIVAGALTRTRYRRWKSLLIDKLTVIAER